MVRQKHGTTLRDWVMGTEREWVFCKPPTSTSTLTWCSTPQRVTEEKAHHCPHTTTQPHASLLTDSTARTQHTHKHTHRTQPNMTGKEKDRKQKVQKKKSEQSLKPILGGKEEDFWGASTYWIILTFTFMHLADAFIQSDLHCIQVTVFFLQFCYQLLLSLGFEPMILALLAPCSTSWATGKHTGYLRSEKQFDNTHYRPDHTSSAKVALSTQWNCYDRWKQDYAVFCISLCADRT